MFREQRAVTQEDYFPHLGRYFRFTTIPLGEHFITIGADVSAIRQAQATIERQNADLRAADERKDRFLATLSHELRNPLAPLKIAAELLGRSGLSAAQLGQTQQVIRRQVGHMALLLDDLLDVARITQGKLVLRRQRCRLAEVVDSAVETVRPLIDRKQHTLEIELPEPAPLLFADPVRLAQVIANLLTNAAKYTDAGGRLSLAARLDGAAIVLHVRDSGIGIHRDALPGLFEMFSQQCAASDRSEGGLGIGLSLVKALVELHGGTVQAHSDGPGLGSVFTVRLPRLDDLQDGPAPAEDALADGGPRRVLVADDNRDAADTLTLLLTQVGHEVRVAYDGHTALALARTFHPHVAVLDIGMPRMDGYELARRLRAEAWGSSLRLIAATGWGDDEARRKAAEAGFDHHLTKPLSAQALQGLV